MQVLHKVKVFWPKSPIRQIANFGPNRQFVRHCFGENIFNIITSVPGKGYYKKVLFFRICLANNKLQNAVGKHWADKAGLRHWHGFELHWNVSKAGLPDFFGTKYQNGGKYTK
jgi:hypothetical protein